MRRLLLALALLFVAPATAWAESCTCDSTFTIAAVTDAGEWDGCTPSAGDDFVISSGCDVTITGDTASFTQDGTASTGLEVASGGALTVTVTDEPIVLTIGPDGLVCNDEATCTFTGGVRDSSATDSPALESDPSTTDYLTSGDIVLCPTTTPNDCTAGNTLVRYSYTTAKYDSATGATGDRHIPDIFGEYTAGGADDVVWVFDPDPTDSYVPPVIGVRELMAVDSSASDYSIDMDVRQGEQAQAGSPLTDRVIFETEANGAFTKGERIFSVDDAVMNDLSLLSTGSTGTVTVWADDGGGQAQATSVGHGLVTNDVVEVRGVTGDVHEGMFLITRVDDDNFVLEGSTFSSDTGDGEWFNEWMKGHKHIGRYLRWDSGAGADPLPDSYIIQQTLFGSDGYDGADSGVTADTITIADRRGVPYDVADTTTAWVDYGDKPGMPIFVASPVRIISAGSTNCDTPVSLNGETNLSYVVIEDSAGVFSSADTSVTWKYVWIKDTNPNNCNVPSGLAVQVGLDNSTDTFTLDHVQISGQLDGSDCGSGGTDPCDQLHGLNFEASLVGTYNLNDVLIKYMGDCIANVTGGTSTGTINLTRVVCERGSASGATDGYLDLNEGTSSIQSTVTDGACIRCTNPAKARLFAVEDSASPAGDNFPSTNWINVTGFFALGSTAIIGNTRNTANDEGIRERVIQDLTMLGTNISTEQNASEFITSDMDHFVIRDTTVRSQLNAWGRQGPVYIANGIFDTWTFRTPTGGSDDPQFADGIQGYTTTGSASNVDLQALVYNVAIIDPTVDDTDCQTNDDPCSVIRVRLPQNSRFDRVLIAHRPSTTPTFPDGLQAGSGLAANEVEVSGLLISDFTGGPTGAILEFSAGTTMADVDWSNVCFFNHDGNVIDTPAGLPTSTIRDVNPGFRNPSAGDFSIPKNGIMDAQGCGPLTGALAPGIHRKSWYHYAYGLEPEYLGQAATGGGGSDQGQAY